jgi:PAS domain S-box-containing protein
MFKRNMETSPVAAHVCQECAGQIENLHWLVSELSEENANLQLLDDALRRNTALFEALLANSVDGVTLTGADRRIVRVVRGLTGFAPGELSGVLIESTLHPDDREILLNCYRQLLDRRCNKAEFDVRAFRPDGSIVYLSGTLTDMLDDPNVLAIVFNYQDVTQRKRGELTMAEFAAIVQKADYSIFTKDTEGNILTWNGGARQMFGYAEEEIAGRHVRILVPEELREEEQAARHLIVENGSPTELRTIRLAKDGERIPVLIELAPIRDHYGRTLGILHLSRRVRA